MAGYLGSVPVPQATQHRESFTCTEGQTSFATAGYTAQFVDVYLNGSHLSPADFTATNGSDVVLAVAASADDVCDIISYTPFEIADQTFTGTTTMDVSLTTGVLTANGGAVFNEGSADVDFRVESNGLPNMFHVDGGEDKIFIGHGATHSYDAYGTQIMMQLEAVGTAPYAGFGMNQNSNDTDSSVLIFGKSRGTALASTTIVQDGDTLGRIEFQGMDGADLETGCSIKGQVDGTPGANDMPGRLVFLTTADGANSATERMRIDSAGNVLVGKTSANSTVAGAAIEADGDAYFTAEGANGRVLYLNRLSSDGDIIQLAKDNTTVGRIGTGPNGFQINGSSSTSGLEFATNAVLPAKNFARIDNAISLGIADERFDDAFVTNGVTTGSDRTEKQDIAVLTSAEMLVAARISQTFHTYRWKDAVVDKGDNARIHTGTIAQEVQAAFTAEGLDAGRYAMFMSNTWWGHDVAIAAIEADDTVEPAIEAADAWTRNDHYYTEDEAPEGSIKKTRLGIRYPELLSFLAAYNEQRFAAIETRLTALEGQTNGNHIHLDYKQR